MNLNNPRALLNTFKQSFILWTFQNIDIIVVLRMKTKSLHLTLLHPVNGSLCIILVHRIYQPHRNKSIWIFDCRSSYILIVPRRKGCLNKNRFVHSIRIHIFQQQLGISMYFRTCSEVGSTGANLCDRRHLPNMDVSINNH